MKRSAEYVLLLGLAGFLVIRGLIPAWREVHSDFANYYVSARLVIEQEPLDRLYDNVWFQEKIREYGIVTLGKFSPFPPITSWMMVPLTSLDPLSAQRIFALVNLMFLLPGIILLKRLLAGWETHHCALLILGAGLGLVNNVAFGQVYWIMTVFILYALLLEKNGHPVPAGIILGVFTSLKYFPIVFIVGYFILALRTGPVTTYSGRSHNPERRLVISSLIMLTAVVAIQFIFFGRFVMTEFFSAAFLPHLDGQISGQGPYTLLFQSWNSLFRNMFVADPELNPHPLLDWPMGKVLLQVFILSIVTGLTLVPLYRYKDAEARLRRAVWLALPALAALVILPASATYHFILLLVPLSILVAGDVIDRKWAMTLLVLYFLIGFIPYGFALRLASDWGLAFAYPRLWLISAIFFIVILGLRKKVTVST